MKLKPKGRKIYHQKTRFERLRTFKSNTGAVVSTVLLVAVLGFVGYSAGGPIVRFLQERKILGVPGQTTEATETPIRTNTLPEETIQVTETEAVTTEPLPQIAPEAPEFRGYLLSTGVLSGEENLQNALNAVPADTTHILIPLKTAGGNLYYATTLVDAGKSGAVKAVMPLESIYEMVAATGAVPVAVVNTLEDHIYPEGFQMASYRMAGEGESWTDAAGKAWLSPFSELTVDYLVNLTEEITQAGFTSIVCEGLRFPDFPESDLDQLDGRCSSPDRFTALADVVKYMMDAAPEAQFYITVDGMSALNNQSETLTAAEMLRLAAVMVTVNSATQANADMLRTLTRVHPSVLVWEGIEVPSGESSFVQAALSEQTNTES